MTHPARPARSLRPILFCGIGCPREVAMRLEEELGTTSMPDFETSPRQADLLVVAGKVSLRLLPVLQRVWQQMPEPKWYIAIGAADAASGPDTYAVVGDLGAFLPVHVRVPGHPPTAEALSRAIAELRTTGAGGVA